MKKILLLLSFAFLVGVCAGQDLSSVIKNMPDELTLKIYPGQKEQLIQNVSDTATVVVTNQLGEKIERLGISDDYIALKTSDVGTLQIKLLPLINNSYIVGVIKTVCDKACDSTIDFYTTSWEPLPAGGLFPVKSNEWFLKTDADRGSDDFINASAALDVTFVKYLFNPTNTNIEALSEMKGYLSAPDYDLLKPFIETENVVLKWNKNTYTK